MEAFSSNFVTVMTKVVRPPALASHTFSGLWARGELCAHGRGRWAALQRVWVTSSQAGTPTGLATGQREEALTPHKDTNPPSQELTVMDVTLARWFARRGVDEISGQSDSKAGS